MQRGDVADARFGRFGNDGVAGDTDVCEDGPLPVGDDLFLRELLKAGYTTR